MDYLHNLDNPAKYPLPAGSSLSDTGQPPGKLHTGYLIRLHTHDGWWHGNRTHDLPPWELPTKVGWELGTSSPGRPEHAHEGLGRTGSSLKRQLESDCWAVSTLRTYSAPKFGGKPRIPETAEGVRRCLTPRCEHTHIANVRREGERREALESSSSCGCWAAWQAAGVGGVQAAQHSTPTSVDGSRQWGRYIWYRSEVFPRLQFQVDKCGS